MADSRADVSGCHGHGQNAECRFPMAGDRGGESHGPRRGDRGMSVQGRPGQNLVCNAVDRDGFTEVTVKSSC